MVRRDCSTMESGGKADLGQVQWRLEDDRDDEPPPPPGKRRLVYAELDNGCHLQIDDGRDVSWTVDLAKRRRNIDACERFWGILRNDAGQFVPKPRFCNDRACPRCTRRRIGLFAHHWVPVLEAAVADGAALYLLTFTQLVHKRPGALVLPHEQRLWKGDAPPGEFRYAVGGESLKASYDRWRGSWAAVRKDRATKGRWRHCLPAYVYGIEWTLRGKHARGRQVPRWHCHGHVLVVVPRGGWPGVEQEIWRQLRKDWLDASPGSLAISQDCRRVVPRDDQTVAGMLLETVKYPNKVGAQTVAATVEAYASQRGLRPHHVGGAWHSNSELSEQEPWRSWRAAAPPIPSWPRLLYRPHRDAVWVPYCGQVREGDAEWSVGRDFWRGDARPYWEALTNAQAESEIWDRALSDDEA